MPQFVSLLSELIEQVLPMLEATYKDLHQNPELTLQEIRTAGIVAQKLRGSGYEVTEKVGKTGVVGVLRIHLFGRPPCIPHCKHASKRC